MTQDLNDQASERQDFTCVRDPNSDPHTCIPDFCANKLSLTPKLICPTRANTASQQCLSFQDLHLLGIFLLHLFDWFRRQGVLPSMRPKLASDLDSQTSCLILTAGIAKAHHHFCLMCAFLFQKNKTVSVKVFFRELTSYFSFNHIIDSPILD